MTGLRLSELETAAELVYRYLMHSAPESWGSHPWADWAMNRDRWDWNPGVGLIAAAEYGAVSAPEVMLDVEMWTKRNLGDSEKRKVVNSIAPFAVFPQLYRATGKDFYRKKAEEIALWVVAQATRTNEGVFEHTVTEDASFSGQIWADTVFMAVLFLARTARLAGNEELAEIAIRQAVLHFRALQDEKTGLLFHGWNGISGDWMSAARWNRANAWNALGVPMIYEEIGGLCSDSELLHELRDRYSHLANALIHCQNDSGLWPTVLDRPGFYEETSGSAGIACGLYKAARAGWVDESAAASSADRTVTAMLDLIREDGAVLGVSGGTPVLESVEAYDEVPIFPTLYGQGMVLLLFTERMRRAGTANV